MANTTRWANSGLIHRFRCSETDSERPDNLQETEGRMFAEGMASRYPTYQPIGFFQTYNYTFDMPVH